MAAGDRSTAMPWPLLNPDDDGRFSGEDLDTLLSRYPAYRDLHLAVVLSLGEEDSAEVYVRDYGYASIDWDGLRWRSYINDSVISDAPKSAANVVTPGDVVRLLHTKDRGWVLAQLPEVQGAMVALDPHDGAILALTGGFDFGASKFNRAVQSRRQPGSSFKPFVYSAALDNGFTPATLVNDAPVVFDDENLEDTWRPENYSRKFNGPTRLREALVRSLNLVSVRVLLGTGISAAIRHMEAFGLPKSALPRDSSLALGSGGAAPLDVASGYSVFASGGFHTNSYVIERILTADGHELYAAEPAIACPECEPDETELTVQNVLAARDAAVVEEEAAPVVAPVAIVANQPEIEFSEVPEYSSPAEAIDHGLTWRPSVSEAPRFVRGLSEPAERAVSAENAYLIYDMMRDVIRRGTGRGARELGRSDLAGKTGTSNDRRDAWFSGFNGDLVATAWVGFDQERSLGAGEEGGRTALPMWKYFMADALRDAPDATISRPPGIVTVRIDPETGLMAPSGFRGAMFEIFEAGHVPELGTQDAGPIFSGPDPGAMTEEEQLF